MAEPTETRQLSGLARSIDALFASPSPASGSGAAPTVITASAPTDAQERTPPPPPAPPGPEIFPASQMLAALPAVPWAGQSEVKPPDASPIPSVGPLAEVVTTQPLEPITEPKPVLDPMLEFGRSVPTGSAATLMEVVAPTSEVDSGELMTRPSPSASEPPRDALDPRAFESAVRAFVEGDSSAGARVEELAVVLRERLSLDPLADAVETLVREAGDPPDPRYLELAGSVINPAVASRIVQRLGEESDEEKREGYLGLCRRLGTVMAKALTGALTGALDRDVRRTYRRALISMGEVSRPVIEGMVQDDNRFLVRDGVAMLAELGGPRAVELVTSALADTDARVRSEALLALGTLKDVGAAHLVLGFLEDSDESVRMGAAVAAGELGLERALKPLLHMLEGESNADHCVSILRALGQIGDPGAVQAIEKHAVPSLFSKPRTEVRVAAYRALHAIGTPHARELIAKAAQDKDPVVRVALRDITRAG